MVKKNYKRTRIACYFGFITQSISANFAPLLFITFSKTYSIGLAKIALIPFVFYLTQLIIDLAATKFVDKIGYRTCVVTSQIISALGLILMAILPAVMSSPFIGIMISVVLYAMGSGLIEVLVSPIIEACPFENKEGMMSLLHSFYCWGAVGVILFSTLFFALFGVEKWQILTVILALIPLLNTFNFLTCPIERLVEKDESMPVNKLLRLPVFWILILLMICAGAAEASMAQWASAFTESAIGVSKTIGDLVGPCMFAFFMGISRMLYGKLNKKLELTKAMLICGILCVACYLVAALSSLPILGLAGCAFCGIAVGIMWPGSISISSQKCPKGGTAMFAFLALAGDLGATASPTIVGYVSNIFNGNLKIGLLVATVFPLILIFCLIIIKLKFSKVSNKN